MHLAPHYRQYELPWTPTEEVEQRFRRVLRNTAIVFILVGLMIPFLPVSEHAKYATPQSDRVVKLVLQNRKPPPPPPPVEKPPEPPKPVEQPIEKPLPKPIEDRQEQARKRAVQALQVFDALNDLRDNKVINEARKDRKLSTTAGIETRSERAMITSKVGRGSGGINNAALSRGYGGTAGPIGDHQTTQVESELTHLEQAASRSNNARATRGREEIDLVFDANKGVIYAVYSRALRVNPDLQGKVVFELTIESDGLVSACRIASSELGDPELEKKLVARVKSFKFPARQVDPITVTKPIEFFPSD